MSQWARSGVWIGIISLAICACSEGEPQVEPVNRFVQAETQSQQWCLRAQLELTRLQSVDLGEANITQHAHETPADLGKGKPSIDTADAMIHIHAHTQTMPNRHGGTETIAKQSMCKLKAIDAIEQALSVEIEGSEGTCRQMNELAMAWAKAQLSPSELSRYEAEGKKLVFVDDSPNTAGVGWYGTPSVFEPTGDTYSLSASSLVVPADRTDVYEELRGVHYCKFVPPSQMLYWLLERAFWEDPLGPGPEQDADAALLEEEGETTDCRLPNPEPPGSCIFYFITSKQHFCEDYSGTDWTEPTAEEKCATRDQGVYKSVPCAQRSDETSVLDGDGVHKGECVVNCGAPMEFRWHVYSLPDGIAVEDACPDWYPDE